jgi:hypothetical protein
MEADPKTDERRKGGMSKIFVRKRRDVGKGAGRPRFAVVAVEDIDLTFFKTRLRRAELERIATEVDASIVYLPRGDRTGQPEQEDRGGHRRRDAE